MANHGLADKEDLAKDGYDEFNAAAELFRRERVFILQPQRVILDERFEELRSANSRLIALSVGVSEQTERDRIGDLLHKHVRQINRFSAEIDAAGEVHDYTNYRSNA